MLIEFLSDVVANMDAFRDDIKTVYVFHDKGNLVATGNHPKMFMLYRVEPLNNLIGELEAPAYLGALGYLRSLLGSTLMQADSRVEVAYQEREGQKVCATSMRFVSKRIDASFECTNPEILNPKERKSEFPRPQDAISFPLTKEVRKEFEEIARAGTPKADSHIFTLGYDGTYIRAVFGTGKHTTQLILTDQISGETTKFHKPLFLDRFRAMIKLAADNGGTAGYHPNAFWVEFNTAQALHTIAVPTIRENKTG